MENKAETGSINAAPAPKRKSANAFAATIGLLLCLGVVLAFMLVQLKEDYELLEHGQIATAAVTAVKERLERRSSGKHGHKSVTVYDHSLAFDGNDIVKTLVYRIAPGTQVDVYYAITNPYNLRIRNEHHPFRSVVDIFSTGFMQAMLGLAVLDFVAMLWFLRMHRRQKRAAALAEPG